MTRTPTVEPRISAVIECILPEEDMAENKIIDINFRARAKDKATHQERAEIDQVAGTLIDMMAARARKALEAHVKERQKRRDLINVRTT